MIIKTREIDNIVVFDVEGEIRRTETAQETLHSLVEAQLDRGRRNVLLNLGGVEFIDSFGVLILASYISTRTRAGSRLRRLTSSSSSSRSPC
jgi:anti-anti-sigma factor